jgi:hypothetical protein
MPKMDVVAARPLDNPGQEIDKSGRGAQLACAFPERAMAGGDFRVATRDGYWVGELVSYSDQPFLTARTFMDG